MNNHARLPGNYGRRPDGMYRAASRSMLPGYDSAPVKKYRMCRGRG